MMICQEICANGADTVFKFNRLAMNLLNFNPVSDQPNLSCSVHIAFKLKEIISIRQHLHGDMC